MTMRSHILFSIIIIFSVSCLTAQDSQPALEDQKAEAASEIEPYVVINETHHGEQVTFYAQLFDQAMEKELGAISFSYNKEFLNGCIHRLHIEPSERKKSYGSILLTFALETLTECKCAVVNWKASPFNLQQGQTAEAMLPKLIAFYQKHGGQLVSADIAYYPKKNLPNN